jgi:hypothetical protein
MCPMASSFPTSWNLFLQFRYVFLDESYPSYTVRKKFRQKSSICVPNGIFKTTKPVLVLQMTEYALDRAVMLNRPIIIDRKELN